MAKAAAGGLSKDTCEVDPQACETHPQKSEKQPKPPKKGGHPGGNTGPEGGTTPTTGPDTNLGSGVRGLNNQGGLISEQGTNTAGGRLFTSTGLITQSDFTGIVNSSLMQGDDVNIITGAHGFPDGSMIPDSSMYADDVRTFGRIPGVKIYNLPSMSPEEIKAVLDGPGTIIGGFCDSGACLAPFR